MNFITDEYDLILDIGINFLYFYSYQTLFHKDIISVIEKLEVVHKNINFLAVDVDYFKKMCNRFSIISIPTIIITQNDIEIKRYSGLISADICDNILGSVI